MKTLRLEKMGCDFWADEDLKDKSDLQNYRLRLHFVDKEGKNVMGDIGHGKKYRFLFKNGKRLKKPSVIHTLQLCVDFQITKDDGLTYGYKTNYIYDYISKEDLKYTSKDLLKLINHLSIDKYNDIEIFK